MWACFWNHFWAPLKNGSDHFFVIFGVRNGSKRVTLFPGWHLLAHLWSPRLMFDSKSEPTAPPKCPQGPKHASKMIPKGPKMILKVSLKVHSLGTLTLDRRFEQRPGGLREALKNNCAF